MRSFGEDPLGLACWSADQSKAGNVLGHLPRKLLRSARKRGGRRRSRGRSLFARGFAHIRAARLLLRRSSAKHAVPRRRARGEKLQERGGVTLKRRKKKKQKSSSYTLLCQAKVLNTHSRQDCDQSHCRSHATEITLLTVRRLLTQAMHELALTARRATRSRWPRRLSHRMMMRRRWCSSPCGVTSAHRGFAALQARATVTTLPPSSWRGARSWSWPWLPWRRPRSPYAFR